MDPDRMSKVLTLLIPTPRTYHDHFHIPCPQITLVRASPRHVYLYGDLNRLGDRPKEMFDARVVGVHWILHTRLPLSELEPCIRGMIK